MLEKIKKLYKKAKLPYHFGWALLGNILYRAPSRKIHVVAVTGTKGKSSTVKILASIYEAAGLKVAYTNTIEFSIAGAVMRNLYKMTTPGRFFLQHFLYKAVKAGCDVAVLEISSEAAAQFRHLFIDFDGFIFLNLAPEHIESHGSYEAYRQAKFNIGKQLERSCKRHKLFVVNADDKEYTFFQKLKIGNEQIDGEHGSKHNRGHSSGHRKTFSLKDARPYHYNNEHGDENSSKNSGEKNRGLTMTLQGEQISSPLIGEFNIANILAAATYALNQKAIRNTPITLDDVANGVKNLTSIAGRAEFVTVPERETDEDGKKLLDRQSFDVIVDYAHTPDSLKQIYGAFPRTKDSAGNISKKICVLGNTGGGRDHWKRALMGKIAFDNCDQVILTNEDPYDEDPLSILKDMTRDIPGDVVYAINNTGARAKVRIILDRRQAINTALSMASARDTVIITGKGTDPYIMGPRGTKIPWSDKEAVEEELIKVLSGRTDRKTEN